MQRCSCFGQVKTVQNSSKQMLLDFDARGQQRMDFLWIIHPYVGQK